MRRRRRARPTTRTSPRAPTLRPRTRPFDRRRTATTTRWRRDHTRARRRASSEARPPRRSAEESPPGGIPPGESHPGHPPGGHPRSRPSTRARVPPTTPREASRRVVFPRRYRPSPPPRRPTARREDTTPPPPHDARASAPPRRAHPRRRRATRPREFVVAPVAKTRRRNEGGSGVGNREGVGNARRGPRGDVVEHSRRRWDPPRSGARIVPKPPRARTRRET